MPVVAQDLLCGVTVSVLFISRFGAATKATMLKEDSDQAARRKYRYQYTMLKVTVLFVVETVAMIAATVIASFTDLAGAMTAMMAVITNLLLLFNFQFNDRLFRIVFCPFLRLQTLCLGQTHEIAMREIINRRFSVSFYSPRRESEHRTETSAASKMGEIKEETEPEQSTLDPMDVAHDHDDEIRSLTTSEGIDGLKTTSVSMDTSLRVTEKEINHVLHQTESSTNVIV